MTRYGLGAGALLLLSASWAGAGGLDRTNQPVGILFEEGSYAELSFGFTSPTLEGVFPLNGASSGDVGESFVTPVLAFKADIDENLSYAVIFEQPFGADVSYADADLDYPLLGSEATFDSNSLTVLGRYRFDNGFSVYGGPRLVETSAELTLAAATSSTTGYIYEGDFAVESDLGYVVGAAYERPEIALRVALTYSSETTFSNDSEFDLTVLTPFGALPGAGSGALPEYSLPQSLNLDFQTGVAPGTLLFGSVRWADWSETEINVLLPELALPGLSEAIGENLNPVVSYPDDYFTYTVGVGRQLTDKLSGAVSVIYEPGITTEFSGAPGTGGSNLSPYDGQLAVLLAGSYEVSDSLEIGGGIRFAKLGDVSTRNIGAEFEDNSAVSVGVRIGYRF